MDRKNTKENAVERSKSHKGKKKLGVSASKSKRTNASKKVKAKSLLVSPSSSSSDDIEEDYAEFLKTYIPEEFYTYGPPPREEKNSQITAESAAKTPKSLKVKTSK
jgi:hypothetical protein